MEKPEPLVLLANQRAASGSGLGISCEHKVDVDEAVRCEWGDQRTMHEWLEVNTTHEAIVVSLRRDVRCGTRSERILLFASFLEVH